MLARLARFSFRKRKLMVFAIWLPLMIGLSAISGALKPDYHTDFTQPNSESKQVIDALGKAGDKTASGQPAQIVFTAPQGVKDPAVQAAMTSFFAVEEVTGVLSHEAERRGLRLRTQVSGESAKVAASAEALNDILTNLVVNALEATSRGGQVIVAATPRDGLCVLTVEDDGPGIPPAVQEKILQPFFTTKSQGTGLGLAIVARRVAEFGGEVNWKSPVRDGRGTRFEVTLPLEEAKK